MEKKIAIILCNLGGPDSPEAVKPFLFNLFNDKAIIGAPKPIRWCLAKFISKKREQTAKEIYAYLGGKSPILQETKMQSALLEQRLNDNQEGKRYKVFIAMRYWHPFTEEAVESAIQFAPDEVVVLPLYPQFSTATSESSINEWNKQAQLKGLDVPTKTIGCYPIEPHFIASHVALLKEAIAKIDNDIPYRVLFSAHGLPKKIIEKGDPYQWQVEQSVGAIVKALEIDELDYQICYQSRVGPLEWIGPNTEDEIIRAGQEGRAIVVVPIAFVSEHSETLVELDIEYKELAEKNGTTAYLRVPTLSVQEDFIVSLATLCKDIEQNNKLVGNVCAAGNKRICPNQWNRCLCS